MFIPNQNKMCFLLETKALAVEALPLLALICFLISFQGAVSIDSGCFLQGPLLVREGPPLPAAVSGWHGVKEY